jgi:hypothetical protein
MWVVIIALICVVTIVLVLGVGVGDADSQLFPEGFFPALWADMQADAGFYMLTAAVSILFGIIVGVFGKRS